MQSIEEIFNLAGQVAVVTGAKQGIGKCIARRLAQQGASVVVIDKDSAEETVSEITAAGGNASWIQADLSQASEAARAITAAVETAGDIHILVNNAGIFPMMPFLELNEETWDRTFDVNLKSATFCTQAAALSMIKAGHGGNIINIGSESSIRPPRSGLVHYVASKGGMEAFTRAAGRELLPHGIRINLVAPGSVLTHDLDTLPEKHFEYASNHQKHLPSGRWGTPDDIAKLVLFMASSASDYIIGQTIIADGGILWLAKLELESY